MTNPLPFNLRSGFGNTLIVDPGAVFDGAVTGGNSIGSGFSSSLILNTGSSSGTISGIDTSFRYFAQYSVVSGANWTLNGTNTFVSGTTLTNAGILNIAGGLSERGRRGEFRHHQCRRSVGVIRHPDRFRAMSSSARGTRSSPPDMSAWAKPSPSPPPTGF